MKSVEHYLTLNYATSVHRDEDGDYVVEVDDLPGCIADGSTPDEAFRNLEAAKRSWIASRLQAKLEVPEPRPEDFSGKILLRLPKSLHRQLARIAGREGVSLNQYLVSKLGEAAGRADERLDMSGERLERISAMITSCLPPTLLNEVSRRLETNVQLFYVSGNPLNVLCTEPGFTRTALQVSQGQRRKEVLPAVLNKV